jgi:two-component system LytT family response regulator
MSKLSCFIVEDDAQALEYAATLLKSNTSITVLGHTAYANEAIKQIQQLAPDIVILDVFLEDGTAFDVLEAFETIPFKIIFTTSYSKYAIEAFKYSAVDFLLKPYRLEQLSEAITRARQQYDNENYRKQLETLQYNFLEKAEDKKLILKSLEAIFIVRIQDIIYAKSDNNYTTFYLLNGDTILVSGALKSYQAKLPSHRFFRVHQSYLIQLACITVFKKRTDELILNASHTIPVAQSKKQELLQRIEALSS